VSSYYSELAKAFPGLIESITLKCGALAFTSSAGEQSFSTTSMTFKKNGSDSKNADNNTFYGNIRKPFGNFLRSEMREEFHSRNEEAPDKTTTKRVLRNKDNLWSYLFEFIPDYALGVGKGNPVGTRQGDIRGRKKMSDLMHKADHLVEAMEMDTSNFRDLIHAPELSEESDVFKHCLERGLEKRPKSAPPTEDEIWLKTQKADELRTFLKANLPEARHEEVNKCPYHQPTTSTRDAMTLKKWALDVRKSEGN
jgi:hypothetical protein